MNRVNGRIIGGEHRCDKDTKEWTDAQREMKLMKLNNNN